MGHLRGRLCAGAGDCFPWLVAVRVRAVVQGRAGSTHVQMPSPIQGQGPANEAIAQRPLEAGGSQEPQMLAQGRSLIVELWVSSRRNWKLVSGIWLAITLGTMAYAVCLVPRYRSVGVLQVSSKKGPGEGQALGELLTGSGSEVKTEVEVVRRRELLLSAAHALKLGVRDPEQFSTISPDLSVTMLGGNPVSERLREIRSSLRYARIPQRRLSGVMVNLRVLSEDDFAVEFLQDESVVEAIQGRIGRPLYHDNLELEFARRPLPIGESMRIWIEQDGLLLEEITRSFHARALGQERAPTNLVQLSYTNLSRPDAQEFVQMVMDKYLQQSLNWQSLRASRSAKFLTEQIEEIQEQLKSDEESLEAFSEKERATGLDVQAEVTVQESARLRAERSKIDMKLDIVDASSRRLRKRLKSQETASLTATFFEDPILLTAVGGLTEQETRRDVLRASYHDKHPLVLKLNREVAEQKQAVLKLLATAKNNLKSQKSELDEGIKKLESHLSGFPHKELELARRARDLEVSQRLYSFLLEKKHEAEIVKASTTTDKRVIDNASFPHRRSSPQRAKIAFMGFLGGGLLGVFAAFQLRFVRRRIDSVERIQEMLDLPVYGTIPALESVKLSAKKKKSEGDERRVYLNPDSLWTDHQTPITEAIRSLCVNVGMIPKTPGRARVIQVTSSESREGKSTVLSNLAVSLRRSGSKVLVIDLDLRKPTQHRIWGVPRSPGYTDLIAEGCIEHGSQGFFQVVGKDQVKLLSSGSKAPETLTVLMHPVFPTLIERFAQEFDYVLIDSPPIFVADSSVIAKHVDLLLVTARPGVVERSSLAMTAQTVARCNVPKGLVFNAVESKHHDSQYYSSYYGYGYAYTDYSSRDYASESEQDAA